jgi:electron transport complex protein RnfE
LALSSSLAEATLLAASLLGVLIITNLTVSLFRSTIDPAHRVGPLILVAAGATALAQGVILSLGKGLDLRLGIFLPLLAVNELVLGRAGGFARQRPAGQSVVDAIGTGAGFSGILLGFAGLREGLGRGTLWGVPVLGTKWQEHAVSGIAWPFGAFLVIGVGLGLLRRFQRNE